MVFSLHRHHAYALPRRRRVLVGLVAEGMPADEILANYPVLEPEDIRHALAYTRSFEPDRASQPNRPDEWT